MNGNLLAVADWHRDKACKAYLSGELAAYERHIEIADRLAKNIRKLRKINVR